MLCPGSSNNKHKKQNCIFENYKYSDFEDRLPVYAEFIVMVNDLADYDDVLRWYLQLNSGGTPHTEDELEKVRQLLEN